MEHAMRIRHTAICRLPSSTNFIQNILKTAQFYKKNY
jgi:hypothetical protein